MGNQYLKVNVWSKYMKQMFEATWISEHQGTSMITLPQNEHEDLVFSMVTRAMQES